MKQYLEVLSKIINEGREKDTARGNLPNTIGISKADISIDLTEGFPLLTTKKMFWKGIVHELLWFLRGETNIKYLIDNNVNIWNGDAYRWYLKNAKDRGFVAQLSIEEFIDIIKNGPITPIEVWDSQYRFGDLGKVYGHQWRNQNGVDQIKDIFEDLKNNPFGRYKILDGWNKKNFPEMALPPCHLLYQFIVRPMTIEERLNLKNKLFSVDTDDLDTVEKLDKYNIPKYYLDLNMYQRSCDTALGVPFNIASMSLLLMIFAKATNMVAGVANWIGGDTHLYLNHIGDAKEQITREPHELPQMLIKKDLNSLEDILELTINDFELVDYKSHPKITIESFVGL